LYLLKLQITSRYQYELETIAQQV